MDDPNGRDAVGVTFDQSLGRRRLNLRRRLRLQLVTQSGDSVHVLNLFGEPGQNFQNDSNKYKIPYGSRTCFIVIF